MLVHVELVIFGDDQREGQVVGSDEFVVEGVEADRYAVFGLDVVQEVGEFIEEHRGVDPSRRCPVQPFLHPEAGALEGSLQLILPSNRQPPNDSLVRLNPGINLRVDQLPDNIILLNKLQRIQHILNLDDLIGVLMVLEEGLEVGEVVVHIDCIGVEVYAD